MKPVDEWTWQELMDWLGVARQTRVIEGWYMQQMPPGCSDMCRFEIRLLEGTRMFYGDSACNALKAGVKWLLEQQKTSVETMTVSDCAKELYQLQMYMGQWYDRGAMQVGGSRLILVGLSGRLQAMEDDETLLQFYRRCVKWAREQGNETKGTKRYS